MRHGNVVGREAPRRRLADALDQALAGRTAMVVVTGEAGIGKTTLVATIATAAAPDAIVGWGTCWGGGVAPGYWPWTQALSALTEAVGIEQAVALASDDTALLASLIPALGGGARAEVGHEGQARFALFDAVGRWLTRVAAIRPVVIVLDDLHWADNSSLELLDFLSRSLHAAPLLIVVAHRHDELDPSTQSLLGGIAARSEHLQLSGLSASEVHSLVTELAGAEVATRRGDEIHRRTGGHPLFVRELASLIDATDDTTTLVPAAVREAILRRVTRATPSTRIVLDVAAVAGTELRPDVLGAVLGIEADEIARAVDDAVAIGVVHTDQQLRIRFVHDLFREALYDELPSTRRTTLHQQVAVALARQAGRSGDIAPAELARHFAAAVPIDGPARAVEWAFAAAADESSSLAFSEAAAHLGRVRLALVNTGAAVSDATWTDLLVAEADALARAGDPEAAKHLLTEARTRARRCDDGSRLAAVAFGMQRLGARFAMPRQDIVIILDEARQRVVDDRSTEAQLTAALARELHHSVAQDRPRAALLSEQALAQARQTDDLATLAVCLLARHDVLWTPGTAPERLDLAAEIVALATKLGDEERRAEGLLLMANALLETGSPAFRPALATYLAAIDALGQPRHRYLALTRRSALALLDGRLDAAAALIDEGASLGERIGEPDAGNVRMSQVLELVRARGEPDEQRAFAAEAVRWWVGAPVHAHAVAAGFLARAGDLAGARRHVHTVLELGSWQADRSYLSSVFIGNLITAAIALGDSELCSALLDELRPIASSCGVNGAVVAFSGSHAHFGGLAAAALGRTAEAIGFLDQAVEVHDRLGATAWEAESRAALEAIRGQEPERRAGHETTGERAPTLRRRNRKWDITYRNEAATVRDVKGLRDLAILLSRPGVDVHVLELASAPVDGGASIEMVDRQALAQYRQRLVDLDDDRAEADRHRDTERRARAEAEQEALLDELRIVTGLGGTPRLSGARASERARKAVSARIKDAIRRLETPMPQLANHLDEAIVTGTWCRYRAEMSEDWAIVM